MSASWKAKLGIAAVAAVVFVIGIVLYSRGTLNPVINAVPKAKA